MPVAPSSRMVCATILGLSPKHSRGGCVRQRKSSSRACIDTVVRVPRRRGPPQDAAPNPTILNDVAVVTKTLEFHPKSTRQYLRRTGASARAGRRMVDPRKGRRRPCQRHSRAAASCGVPAHLDGEPDVQPRPLDHGRRCRVVDDADDLVCGQGGTGTDGIDAAGRASLDRRRRDRRHVRSASRRAFRSLDRADGIVCA